MYLPKVKASKNTKPASKVLPKVSRPQKNRELIETNNISTFSERRLQAKHRSKVAVPSEAPVVTQSIDEVLEVSEAIEKVEEAPVVVEDTVEDTVEVAESVEEVEEVVEEVVEETLDLTSMTKKELIALAKKHKVRYKNLTKDDLISALSIVLG